MLRKSKPTIENLTTLMVSDIDEDRVDLKRKNRKIIKKISRPNSCSKKWGYIFIFN